MNSSLKERQLAFGLILGLLGASLQPLIRGKQTPVSYTKVICQLLAPCD